VSLVKWAMVTGFAFLLMYQRTIILVETILSLPKSLPMIKPFEKSHHSGMMSFQLPNKVFNTRFQGKLCLDLQKDQEM
jgi:hypothetical protein